MLDLIGIAIVMSVIFVFPIATVTAGLLGASIARNWFQLQRERLAFDREALTHQVELQRWRADMPPWLDRDDPMEIAAWRAALKETYALGMRRVGDIN